jgi:hypothetical protein
MSGNLGGWTSLILFVPILINFAFAFLIGNVAQKKERSKTAFFWLTVVAGPIIMGIVVAALPASRQPQPSKSSDQ